MDLSLLEGRTGTACCGISSLPPGLWWLLILILWWTWSGCRLPSDQDRDGFPIPLDCHDLNRFIYPGALEYPYNGIDEDCSGTDLIDVDQDGKPAITANGLDCDDLSPNTYPGADEICDGQDNACTGCRDDADCDGWVNAACVDPLYLADCDDSDPAIHPHSAEIPYDGIDQDCLQGDLEDVDMDGFSAVQVGGTDCDDADWHVTPDSEVLIPAGPAWVGALPASAHTDGTRPPTLGPAQMLELPPLPLHLEPVPAFCIDRSEVDNNTYLTCEALGRCSPPAGNEDAPALEEWYKAVENRVLPVVGVTLEQAEQVCAAQGKRLATEAEWEKAARGGLCLTGTSLELSCPLEAQNPFPTRLYPWGDAEPSCGRTNFLPALEPPCIADILVPVLDGDALPAGVSPYGIGHLAGNVAEWVRTAQGSHAGIMRGGIMRGGVVGGDVVRGGGYTSGAGQITLTARRIAARNTWQLDVGVRCARDVPR